MNSQICQKWIHFIWMSLVVWKYVWVKQYHKKYVINIVHIFYQWNQETYETLIEYILEKRKSLRILQNNVITIIYIYTDKNHIARYCQHHQKWKEKWISYWKHIEQSVDRRFSIQFFCKFIQNMNHIQFFLNKNDWQLCHSIDNSFKNIHIKYIRKINSSIRSRCNISFRTNC